MLLEIKNSKIDKFAQKANYLHGFWIFMKVFLSIDEAARCRRRLWSNTTRYNPHRSLARLDGAYRNGKVVNTMERKMTEGQYHKDVAQKLNDSAALGGRKVKVTRSSPWSGSKVDKIEERAVDTNSGNRYRYVTKYTFPEPKTRKSVKRK